MTLAQLRELVEAWERFHELHHSVSNDVVVENLSVKVGEFTFYFEFYDKEDSWTITGVDRV